MLFTMASVCHDWCPSNPWMHAGAAVQLVHGGLVPSYVREAMRRANEERPGTCHIELPEDVARETVRVRSKREQQACARADEHARSASSNRRAITRDDDPVLDQHFRMPHAAGGRVRVHSVWREQGAAAHRRGEGHQQDH